MIYSYNLHILFIFISFQVFSQEALSSKIIDSISKKPIALATISINNSSGVISNSNGEFLMYLNKKPSNKDSLIIRCLGYTSKRFLAKTFQDSIIILSPKSIELDEVLVSNKKYSALEIIEKIKENLENNYDFNFIKSKLFYRASNFTNLLQNDVKIKKTTIPEFNQNFIDSLLNDIPKNNHDYTEILANLYGKMGVLDSQKLDIIKASHLYDKSSEISFEGYEKKFNEIIKNHVKRNSYFKIKSGVFGTKEEIDSSFFGENKEPEDKTDAFIEAQKEDEKERKKNFLAYRKTSISSLQKNSFIFEDSDLNFLEKSNKYIFKLEDYSFINDDFVYKISFKPKRNADFYGTIYVNTDNYAIVRVEYKNVKSLKNFKLLGISYHHYLKKGTLIYDKNNSNKYALKYAEVEEGKKFGIKRPLKIIEKNKHTRGRRKQNELSSNIHFIISSREKKELVIFKNEALTEPAFTAFIEKLKVEPIYLPKYDPDFWKGYNVIEPNQAIKDFKSME